MPSKFGIRKHIRQLLHHPPKKTGKANLPGSSSTTDHKPPSSGIPSSSLVLPPLSGLTNEPFELHHSFPAPDHLNINGISGFRSPSEGEPLGAGLDDVLYPPPNNHSTIQSVLPSPGPSEPDLDPFGLGPRLLQRDETYIGERLAYPGSEISATPIGGEPAILWGRERYEAHLSAHTELPVEDYFSPRLSSVKDIGKENKSLPHDFSGVPPEAINVLPEPPKLESRSTDGTSLALESARLRKFKSRGQHSSTDSSDSLWSAKAAREKERHSSVDSGSVYSRNSVSESLQASNTPSGDLNRLELPPLRDNLQPDHCESPVLGWPNHSSEYAAMVDPLVLNASEEVLENQKDDPSRYVDSGFWERRHTPGIPTPHALDQNSRENFQREDSVAAQLRREFLFQDEGQPSSYQGNEALHLSTQQKGMAPAYYHDAEIYRTLVPSVTHSIDTHVSYNSPIIHERTIHQHHEIRHDHIIRDVHTHEVRPALQPVVKPEYLPAKHVVELQGGGTRDITEEEASSGNYPVLARENRVVAPAFVRNIGEYLDDVRDIGGGGSSGQEGPRYGISGRPERVPSGDRRGTFGHVQEKP